MDGKWDVRECEMYAKRKEESQGKLKLNDMRDGYSCSFLFFIISEQTHEKKKIPFFQVAC